MHRKLAEELNHLLRRIEQLPTAPLPGTGAGRTDPPGRRAVLRSVWPVSRWRWLRSLRAGLRVATVLALAVLAVLTAVHMLPWPAGPGADSRPGEETALAPMPAQEGDTPPAVVAGGPPADRIEPAAEPPIEPADATRRSAARPALPHAVPKPTLSVLPIHAASGQKVRVAMRIEPGTFSSRAFQVSVHGLPEGASFTQGSLIAPDRWLIPASALGSLELALGDAPPGRFELVAELRGASGKPIAETKSTLVVSAPGDHSAAPQAKLQMAVATAPAKRAGGIICRPCRCYRASPIYYEYRPSAGWVALAGRATTTCYVATSIN
jgi:hypothetical protein